MLYLWVGRHPVVPLVLMCRVWRWRDVEVDQLVRLPICQYTPDILLECCNPYHWARGANPGIVFCIQYSYSVSIYIYLLVCLSVSNKRQNCWTHRDQILCGTPHDPRESFCMIKISKISLQQNSIFIKFWKSKIFFYQIRKLFLLLYTTTSTFFYSTEVRSITITEF